MWQLLWQPHLFKDQLADKTVIHYHIHPLHIGEGCKSMRPSLSISIYFPSMNSQSPPPWVLKISLQGRRKRRMKQINWVPWLLCTAVNSSSHLYKNLSSLLPFSPFLFFSSLWMHHSNLNFSWAVLFVLIHRQLSFMSLQKKRTLLAYCSAARKLLYFLVISRYFAKCISTIPYKLKKPLQHNESWHLSCRGQMLDLYVNLIPVHSKLYMKKLLTPICVPHDGTKIASSPLSFLLLC